MFHLLIQKKTTYNDLVQNNSPAHCLDSLGQPVNLLLAFDLLT